MGIGSIALLAILIFFAGSAGGVWIVKRRSVTVQLDFDTESLDYYEGYAPSEDGNSRNKLRNTETYNGEEEELIDQIEDGKPINARTVFFGTDRLMQKCRRKKNKRFGGSRGSLLTYGRSTVAIPNLSDVKKLAGEASKRDSPGRRIAQTLQKFGNNATEIFGLPSCIAMSAKRFSTYVSEAIEPHPIENRSAIVFVHGYNVQFKNALFKAAQIAENLDVRGPMFVYSWPSKGKIKRYLSDGYTSRQSAKFLDEFINRILETEGLDRVHIISHSMGNRLLVDMFTKARTRLRKRRECSRDHGISQLIMAAPDVDEDIFDDALDDFAEFSSGITVYACKHDKPLMISNGKACYKRAGQIIDGKPVFEDSRVDVIDVSAVCNSRIFGLNHSLFAENQVLFDDMKMLIASGDGRLLDRGDAIKSIPMKKISFWRC